MKVTVTYTLERNSLTIHYEAVSDADTVCNLKNHSYLNLAGHSSGSALNQELKLNAECHTPQMPTAFLMENRLPLPELPWISENSPNWVSASTATLFSWFRAMATTTPQFSDSQ